MSDQTRSATPPMKESDEATAPQLELARLEGDATGRAVEEMVTQVADDGAEVEAGEYYVAYALEKPEGLYYMTDAGLEWREPEDKDIHIEVAVRDRSDGRFIPGLTVYVTLLDSNDNVIETHQQPFVWHPWLYHYGRNWQVPGEGLYTLRARIQAPTFARHDKKNGLRYAEDVEVEFKGVRIKTGQKKS